MAKAAKPKLKPKARAKASALALQPANGVPGVKKLKKKSFVVIEAPPGTTFQNNFQVTTTVSKVERLPPEAMTFDISKQELLPKNDPNPTKILLSIKGTKVAKSKTRPKKLLVDPPDPGNLTITLTDPGPNINPIVTLPVVFVDDFDP